MRVCASSRPYSPGHTPFGFDGAIALELNCRKFCDSCHHLEACACEASGRTMVVMAPPTEPFGSRNGAGDRSERQVSEPIYPFQMTKPVEPDEVIGRDTQITQLKNLALEGNNARLVAPRRFGKTSLLRRVQSELPDETWTTVYVDLMGIVTMDDVASRIERAYTKSLKGPIAQWFVGLQRTLRPTEYGITFSSDFGRLYSYCAKDDSGWCQVSAAGHRHQATAEQVLSHLLAARANVKSRARGEGRRRAPGPERHARDLRFTQRTHAAHEKRAACVRIGECCLRRGAGPSVTSSSRRREGCRPWRPCRW
jgi:hypothetical protein